ncbi:MAG TPA: copper resistance protein B [Solirubrobacteraceae bacterium]|nr:copper resistance protein B [Solirubrobacteraceae bacterium]
MLLAALLPAISVAQQQPTEPGWPQPVNNQQPFAYAILNQNEIRTGDGQSTYRWDAEGWWGDDINRAWVKSEGNLDTGTGLVDEAEAQLLYSRAVSSFFNLQAGVRQDFEPSPSRSWAALGVEGLAPLNWDIGATLFVSDAGHVGGRLEGYYDLLFTQRLILQPQFELNLYSRADPRRGLGGGFSDLDTGLRLRYEIRRQLAPYVGITYENRYGDSARFARLERAPVELVRFVAGVRLWL